MPSFPADRNLGTELTNIGQQLGGLSGAAYQNYANFSPQYTNQNVGNFTSALRGNFDAGAWAAANPGGLEQFNALQSSGQLQGWTPEQFAYANSGNNQGALDGFYRGGIAGQLRQSYDAANPQQTAFNTQLGTQLGALNGQGPAQATGTYSAGLPGVQTNTAGFTAASFNPQQAQGATASFNPLAARYNAASGGPLLGSLQRDAARNLGNISPLQAQQQSIAQNLLSSGSGLTAGETAGVQDAARAAYADRGLVRSNRGIGAEILLTDAAQRNRLTQNLGLAQGIDAAGQQQIGQNRNYALGVQGQGQNLSTFNAGQQNALGQFNAGQANSIGASLAQFNAGQAQQNSQFNAGQANAIGSSLAQFNAGGINAMNQDAASRADTNARFNFQGATQNNQFNAGAANDLARFNTGLQAQNQNDQWSRSMQLGSLLNSQAINPGAYAAQLATGTPDYTQAALGYGQDVYNTNYNAAASRYNSAANNRSSLIGAGLGAIGTVLGGPIGGMAGKAIGGLFG